MRTLLAFCAAFLLLSVGPGATASTSTPPRNGLIALGGADGIYIVDPQAGTSALMPKSADLSEPAWSPDGTTLAVTGPYGEGSAVYTVKPDGTERTLVLQNAYSPSWSPDGKQLVVVRENRDAESTTLAIVDSDGSDARTLEVAAAERSLWLSSPEWSPDGKLIAFVATNQEGPTSVELVSLDGKSASIPDVAANSLTGLSWSPDSSSLAFDRYVETKDGGHSVAVLRDLATGKETVYRGEQVGAQAPTWSPQGDQLAFLSATERPGTTTTTATHSCGGESSVSHLWVMSPNGAKAHKLVEGEYYGTPSWGPASQAAPAPVADEQPAPAPPADQQPAPAPPVEQEPAPAVDEPPANTPPTPAATSEPPAKSSDALSTKGLIAVRGSNGIYLVNPDNAAAHKVPDTADMIAPYWSPDGGLLAVERVGTDGSSSIYTIKPDGTQPRLVAKNGTAPSWSAAGDRVFFVQGGDEVLFSAKPDGSDLQEVDAADADAYEARELAWRTDGSPIWFFEDGSANSPGSFDTSAAQWAPDESRIAFIGALGPTDDEAAADTVTAGLWIVSADGGAPQLLLEGASGRPSWPY